MRARQAAPIYFISTLIKRKLIATSLIMLQQHLMTRMEKRRNKTLRLRGRKSLTCSGAAALPLTGNSLIFLSKTFNVKGGKAPEATGSDSVLFSFKCDGKCILEMIFRDHVIS